jgi:hypothetical protein
LLEDDAAMLVTEPATVVLASPQLSSDSIWRVEHYGSLVIVNRITYQRMRSTNHEARVWQRLSSGLGLLVTTTGASDAFSVRNLGASKVPHISVASDTPRGWSHRSVSIEHGSLIRRSAQITGYVP